MKHWLVLLFVLVVSEISFAQSTYFIKDKTNNEVIPFVKIYPDQGTPFIADIDGMFTVNVNIASVQLRASGFKDTTIQLSEVKDQILFMSPYFQEIQEVTAVAGENPAHRIMNLVIANRKKNHPMENDAFRYESYSKFIFDIDREALEKISANSTDSTILRINRFFDQQYLFMLESASTRTFIPPARDKEEITAYKVSGFNDPMFSTFASELQSFSYYENQVKLMGKDYVNPIAFGGTNRYLFILQDTTVVGSDTTFTIFYRPRKGKNFDGMTGQLFINTKGYAIEKVTASPYSDTTGNVIKIIQEYAFTNDKKWFPSKLSTEIDFSGIKINPKLGDLSLQGKGNTYIREVTFDKEKIGKGYFDNVSVVVAEDAAEIKDKDWDTLRQFSINDREKRTYFMIDSLSKATGLDKRLTALKVLAEGKIPLGYFNMDIYRLISFNQYEGYRFGAGLETSRKMMKPVVLGGYFGWANRDKQWKYGAYSTIHLYRKMGIRLDLKYQQDLIERGTPGFQKNLLSLNSTDLYRNFFMVNMDKQRLAEAVLSGYIKGNIKLSVGGNFQRIWFTKDYRFFSPDGIQASIDRCDNAELFGELIWNIREQVMLVGDQRVSKGTSYPKIKVRAARGISGVYTSMYDYWRINAEISQQFRMGVLGSFSYCIAGGQTIGDVPLYLQQMGNGTGRPWNFSVMNTFETMLPGAFYNDRQAALFTRIDFTTFKTKAKWNEPQICLHHAIGYGTMTRTDLHSQPFSTMEKGYFEGGVIVNNLIVSGFTGIGFGGFYNYGPYSNADWKKNIFPKFSVKFAF